MDTSRFIGNLNYCKQFGLSFSIKHNEIKYMLRPNKGA